MPRHRLPNRTIYVQTVFDHLACNNASTDLDDQEWHIVNRSWRAFESAQDTGQLLIVERRLRRARMIVEC